MNIKPKSVRYKGVLFKSKLEARWAVFFDNIEVKWRYEPKQFRLGYYPAELQQQDEKRRGYDVDYRHNDLVYTPDFWLPSKNVWVEIKPMDLTETEKLKVSRLAYSSGKDVLVFIGLDRFFRVWTFDSGYFEALDDLKILCECDNTRRLAMERARNIGRDRFKEFREEDFDNA